MLSVVSKTSSVRRCIAVKHHTPSSFTQRKQSDNISRHFSTEMPHSSNEMRPSEVESFDAPMCISPLPVLSGKKAREFLSDLLQQQNVQNTLNAAETYMSIVQKTAVNGEKGAEFSSDSPKNLPALEALPEKVSAVDYFFEKIVQLKNSSNFYTNPSIFRSMPYMVKAMLQQMEEGKLTQKEFDKYAQECAAFRECMLAHIYLTTPFLTKQAAYALKNGDYQKVAAFAKQLKENGDASIKHLALAEEAFNAIGQYFGLPNVTAQQTLYETSLHPYDELPYAIRRYSNMADILWRENPALLFLAQEVSSYETGSIAKDICAFFEALTSQIDPQKYNQMIVPYLEELKSDSFYCQRVLGAREEIKSSITNMDEAKKKLAVIRSFLKLQRDCFESAQYLVRNYAQSTPETVFYPGYSPEKQKISTVLSRGILDALTSSEPL